MVSHTTVFVDGSVYSPVDPYATALLLTGQAIEWVGGDSGAQSILDETMAKVELKGDLLTPAFVHGGSSVKSKLELEESIAKLKSFGYSAGAFFVKPEAFTAVMEELSPTFICYFYAKISGSEDLSKVPGGFHGIQVSPNTADIKSLLQIALQKKLKVSFSVESAGDYQQIISLMEEFSDFERAKLATRIDGVQSIDEEPLEGLKNLGIGLGFSSNLRVDDSSLNRAVASGALIFLGSETQSISQNLGWELALSCVVRAEREQQISARATFNAMTRGVYRALGESNPAYGQLAPQAPADIARWKVTELMVQTSDERVAAWSTDPRARIPLLPVLEQGKLPELAGLYISGALQAD